MSQYNTPMIMRRLQRMGYIDGVDCFEWTKFMDFEYYIPIFWVYTQNKVCVSSSCIIPSTRCNLNCEKCLNFTPYLKEVHTRSLDALKDDIDLFFKWIDYVPRYQISGGEPLLYPDLDQLIFYINSKYRCKIKVLEIVLNGTIIPTDYLCDILKKHNVRVYLDNYTEAMPRTLELREKIITKLQEYQIEWIDNTVEEWFDLDIFNTDNTCMDEREIIEYFDMCNNPWHCYEDGKIYACNFAAFAIKAGLSEEIDSEYFDISKMDEHSRKSLVEFCLNYNEKGYVKFCERCAGWCSINKKRVPVAVQVPKKGNTYEMDK